jgi:hypothetical protein
LFLKLRHIDLWLLHGREFGGKITSGNLFSANRHCFSATSTKHFLLASQMLLTHHGIKLACPFPITFAEPTVVESIRLICTLATSRT